MEAYLHDAVDSSLDGTLLIGNGAESKDKLLLQKRRNVLDLYQTEDLELLEGLKLQQQVDGLGHVKVEVGELLGVDALLEVRVVESSARALEDLGAVNVGSHLPIFQLLDEGVMGFLGLRLGVGLGLGVSRLVALLGSRAGPSVGRRSCRRTPVVLGSCNCLVIDRSRECSRDRESQAGKDGGVDELHFDGGIE
ncbi:uncharacterized protein PG998_004145 [Apiospora kogelbergensis]|uniref:Uncharacterized protein n=1 Tax=Apiospora kogelbergensis TaxID=1337665 RepID=A0AAW0QIS2_9PEZI